ncbi:MAG: hypothetical protein RLY82_1148, partial [Pseudomonadota bacterium]
MSELNLFQKLFKRKSVATTDDAALMPNFESTKTAESSLFQDNSTAAAVTVTTTAAQSQELEQEVAASVDSSATADNDNAVSAGDLIAIPVLGSRTVVAHQRILAALLALALIVLALVTFFALTQADKVTQQLSATGQALMQSQRLAKSVSQAIVGTPQAFPDVKESADVLARSVRALKAGDEQMRIDAVPVDAQVSVDIISPLMERAEKNAKTVIGQQKILTQVGTALRTINRQSSDLLEIAETVSSLKLQ